MAILCGIHKGAAMTKLTIKDVATTAGVSIATVSRVLNDPERVKPETVALVQAAIAGLRYRPNVNGRRLKTATSQAIGVLLPSIGNPVFADSLAGIEAAAQAAGYTLLLTTSSYDPAREDAAIATLLGNRVDGLILTVADADGSAVVRSLRCEGVPYVLLYNQPHASDIASVSVDNAGAARAITEHLIALGHRRFAMIAGSFASSDRSRLRWSGVGAALAAVGLPAARLVETGFSGSDLPDALTPLLTGPDRPTALVCSNDMLALATMRGCRALGLDVPGDVSVVGFDGIGVGELVQPSLCTVVQPTREMGRQAIDILLGLIEGRESPRSILLPHTIREGESTAPPPPAPRQPAHDREIGRVS
ncbi:MAG: LacI family DNA-binding transcriptional regulator [Caenispirillum sp.]|nr:LacI family DNA-binding transcriptional regulator [Caenispirillum sp.]